MSSVSSSGVSGVLTLLPGTRLMTTSGKDLLLEEDSICWAKLGQFSIEFRKQGENAIETPVEHEKKKERRFFRSC